MNRLGFLLLAALASKGALASEVGAPHPQFASFVTANLAVAIAETGANTSWVMQPHTRKEASASEHAKLNRMIDDINRQVSAELEQHIDAKLSELVGY